MLFEYTGDAGRTYHDIGSVEPGAVHDLAADPADGRWRAVDPQRDNDTDKDDA